MQMREAIKVIGGLLNIFFSKIIKLNGNNYLMFDVRLLVIFFKSLVQYS